MTAPNSQPLVGVLGGVGPLATAYFLERVVSSTEAERDQDHLDLLVYNHSTVPDRTDFLLGKSPDDPGPVLADDARRLEAFGVDLIVMPCNTAHHFTRQVINAITVPFISIIGVTVAEARRRNPDLKVVGLLATEGTVDCRVYHDAFAAHGVEVVAPDAGDQEIINSIIYDQVKAGQPVDLDALLGVVERLVERGAEVIVLGCTELSVIAIDHDLLTNPLFLDSMEELVHATITRAGHQVREPYVA